MASRKTFLSKPRPNFIYPAPSEMVIADPDSLFEFDESEIWNNSNIEITPSPAAKKWIPSAARKIAVAKPKTKVATTASSLPVNVPDWANILKQEDGKLRKEFGEYSDEDFDSGGGDDDRIPPHEYLARTRGASFSVHEGVGRTLKGRDLRRVRNAIWKKVGFED